MPPERVLIVDDEAIVRDVLTRYLEKEGFRVETAADGEEALAILTDHRPDLVILDLMLPKVDGLEVFRRLRAEQDVPVVMVTAKGEEVDRVVGLELGADDYVVKPFSPREVVARVRAVLRRGDRSADHRRDGLVIVGPFAIDRDRREVRRDGRLIELTRKEFDLLCLLASQPGAVVSRRQLMSQVWGEHWSPPSRTIDTHVASLRRKLGPDDWITTIRGVGLCFEPADHR